MQSFKHRGYRWHVETQASGWKVTQQSGRGLVLHTAANEAGAIQAIDHFTTETKSSLRKRTKSKVTFNPGTYDKDALTKLAQAMGYDGTVTGYSFPDPNRITLTVVYDSGAQHITWPIGKVSGCQKGMTEALAQEAQAS